jgi:hypothetical protein
LCWPAHPLSSWGEYFGEERGIEMGAIKAVNV